MTKRILLIEDYPVVQELYGNALKQAGFTVEVAGDGSAALEALKDEKKKYDYVLVDMLLPQVSGSEFLEQYKKRIDTKVIVLSDFSDPYTVDKAFNLGIHNYWLKAENTPSQLAEKLMNYPGDDPRANTSTLDQ
jgi:CheY-like chemotaxis protein